MMLHMAKHWIDRILQRKSFFFSPCVLTGLECKNTDIDIISAQEIRASLLNSSTSIDYNRPILWVLKSARMGYPGRMATLFKERIILFSG